MTKIVGPINVFTAFIDIAEEEQITELEQYLNDRGLNIPIDEDEEQVNRIVRINEACRGIYSNPDITPQELENVMYTLVSLFHIVPKENTAKLLDDLCITVLTGTTSDNVRHRLRLLDLLFCQFDIKNIMASVVLWHKLRLAVDYRLGSLLYLDLSKLKKWMDGWKFSLEDRRKMFKLLWEVYKSTSLRNIASQILIDLLSTYTDSLASESEVIELVKDLVVLAISDPDRYIFNELLELEAVQSQQPEKIYQLLEIFVNGRYSTFVTFCDTNKEYLESLGLDFNACQRKMKLLTLLSLAEGSSEISFSIVSSELQLDINNFEQLIIDAIRFKLLNARIDHVNQKLLVTNCVRRTFDINEWKVLHDHLSTWKQNISVFRSNLKSLQQLQTSVQ